MSEPGAMDQAQETSKPFSLAPSIFLSFQGFTKGTSMTMEPGEKLQRIVENLNMQQERVRGNMLFLVTQQAERLAVKANEDVAKANEDLFALSDELIDTGDGEMREKESVKALWKCVRSPAWKGSHTEDFDFFKAASESNSRPSSSRGVEAGNGDVQMGGSIEMSRSATRPGSLRGDSDVQMRGTGTEMSATTPRSPPNGDINIPQFSPRSIATSHVADMKELVTRGVKEMECYDSHAKEVALVYKQALERRMSKGGAAALAAPSPINTNFDGTGGGISGSLASQVDAQGVRRLSTGMPIPGSSSGTPVRVKETIEELARRGSR